LELQLQVLLLLFAAVLQQPLLGVCRLLLLQGQGLLLQGRSLLLLLLPLYENLRTGSTCRTNKSVSRVTSQQCGRAGQQVCRHRL
jgi:hypothetical protein